MHGVVSDRLAQNLDKIDKLRHLTGQFTDDIDIYEELSQNIPQVVVLGMQSSGKSSTLSRISGIKFPSSDNLCTRVPIEVKLRRGKSSPVRVTLKGPEAFEKEYSSGNESDDIKLAQDNAKEISKQDFPNNYIVEVFRESEELFNVTLVDLPGSFAPKNDDDEIRSKYVEELATRYASLAGSIVLHVMGTSEDYANVITKRMISRLDPEKVITVLTKLDTPLAQSRLQEYLRETHNPRFAVLGNFEGSWEEEKAHLLKLPYQYGDRIRLGSKELLLYVESTINEDTTRCFPILRELVFTFESRTREKVHLNQEYPSHTVIQMLIDELKKCFPNDQHGRELRCLIEKMRSDIQKLKIRPLTKRDADLISSSQFIPRHRINHNKLRFAAEDDDIDVGDEVINE